jgi:hypothetical protein
MPTSVIAIYTGSNPLYGVDTAGAGQLAGCLWEAAAVATTSDGRKSEPPIHHAPSSEGREQSPGQQPFNLFIIAQTLELSG